MLRETVGIKISALNNSQGLPACRKGGLNCIILKASWDYLVGGGRSYSSMTACNWNREEWKVGMVDALAPLVQTVTAEPHGVKPVSNEHYRALAEYAKTDERAKAYFDHLFPKLNGDPSELIDLLCRHPELNRNTSGVGNDLSTFVVMPSGGSLLQMSILARKLTKSALMRGCVEAVDHLDTFLSLSAEGRVPGYEIWIFRGLALSGEIEIAPGLEIIDYHRAAERGLVKSERPELVDKVSDYAGMSALVLAREMTWGPCLVPPRTSRDQPLNITPEFRWAPGCGTGIVFDLLSVCTSHGIQILFISYSAPEFVDVSSGFVSGSGSGYIHSEGWKKRELTEEHVRHLQDLLGLWSHFKSDERETLEMAVNRLSSSIYRNRGRFWLQDRILDAAICLEIMYQLQPPELTNKLATRAAHLIEKERDKRIEIFNQVYAFYDARSNVAHGEKGKRQGKGKKKTTYFEEAADLGFALASRSLRALLKNGEFPKWKELIMSP